jgi:trimeric autotransporter adhesin
MKKIFTILTALCFYFLSFSQSVGIGTAAPDNSSALEISNSAKGLLIPRMTSVAITAITNPAKGLMVYDSTVNQLMVNMGSPATPNWQNIVSNNSWGLTGNANTDTAVNFIGTTDSIPLFFRINNQPAGRIDSAFNNQAYEPAGNTYLGYGAGKYTSTGNLNTAFGYKALDSSTTGNDNTALGAQALNSSTNPNDQHQGNDNTAAGYRAIYHENYFNPLNCTATGYMALYNGLDGATATGYQANPNGAVSNAVGTLAGAQADGIGAKSNGIGYTALYHSNRLSNDGKNNVGNGFQALYNNVNGSYNIAFGAGALYQNDYGFSIVIDAAQNTAVGAFSLINTTHAEGNVALGYNSGHSFDNGYYNCFIGSETDADGPQYYNSIALGHGTLVTAPNMMRVGNGATTSVGGLVGWSVISDGRVKKNIQANVPGLAFINKLRPVTYTIDLAAIDRIVKPTQGQTNSPLSETAFNSKASARQVPAFMTAAFKAKEQIVYSGFVAQEVEQAAKSINFNFSGVDAAKNDRDLYSLRYADFSVPLIKAVQELALQYNDLKKENEKLLKQKDQVLEELAELVKKVH